MNLKSFKIRLWTLKEKKFYCDNRQFIKFRFQNYEISRVTRLINSESLRKHTNFIYYDIK
jgi:hypothetical protein